MRFLSFMVAIVIVATSASVSLAQPRYGLGPFGGFFDPLDRSSAPQARAFHQHGFFGGGLLIRASKSDALMHLLSNRTRFAAQLVWPNAFCCLASLPTFPA
jgi:hypothetical protein